MEQLLHEQLLQAASARGFSYSRLAALRCQERESSLSFYKEAVFNVFCTL